MVVSLSTTILDGVSGETANKASLRFVLSNLRSSAPAEVSSMSSGKFPSLSVSVLIMTLETLAPRLESFKINKSVSTTILFSKTGGGSSIRESLARESFAKVSLEDKKAGALLEVESVLLLRDGISRDFFDSFLIS